MRGGRRWFLAGAVTALLGACTGGHGSPALRPAPSTTTITVLPAADRIRLGQPRLGGPASCGDDAYCAMGLTRLYGIPLGPRIVALPNPDAVVGALVAGAIDIGVLPRAAAQVDDPRVTEVIDDRQLAPATNLVPVLTSAQARAGGPLLAATLDQISSELTPGGLGTIERSVAAGTPPQTAARDWLGSHVAAAVPAAAPAGSAAIVIGARSDATSSAVAAVYAGALARYGWSANVVALGGRAEELDALRQGNINMVVDEEAPLLERLSGFTGSASADTDLTLALLRKRLADLDLVAMAPSPARPGRVFVIGRAVAAALGAATLSDLARAAGAHPPPTPTTTTTADPLSATAVAPGDVESPPPPAPPLLGVGSVGDAVTALQTRLAALGYLRTAPSATFDEATRRAVEGFQLDAGVLASGSPTPSTLRALVAARLQGRPATAPVPGDPPSLKVPLSASGPNLGAPAGTIYLAFAGGPGPITAAVVEALRTHQATATFFVDADEIAVAADTIRRAASLGDAVGVSEPSHDASTAIGAETMVRTAARTQEALGPVVSRTPTCVLAPFGAVDGAARQRLSAAGFKPVLWDIDPQDWRQPGVDVISSDLISNARAGSIVLLHDGGGRRDQTATALSTVLEALSARGYGFSAIPEC